MKQLRIVNLDMEQYRNIMFESQDSNRDLCYWDYPLEELDYLMEDLLDEDNCDYDIRYLALIGKRLYELSGDFKEVD